MMTTIFKPARAAAAVLALTTLSACQGLPGFGDAGVTRHPNPGAGAVTAKAVEVAGTQTLVFVSGNTPLPRDPKAAEYSAAYWGDTEAQTASAFDKIAAALAGMGLRLADVVKVQAYLVAPPAGTDATAGTIGGTIGATPADLAGFGRGYARYFGAASGGRLPARTVVTVAALGKPGMLVEIEVTAVRPAPIKRNPIHR